MKRSGKWYRKNERQVMRLLGLKPTKNSGSGWIEKEDGQSDDVLCQLKSTDANSIKVDLKDLHTLEYNASVAKKLPVFAIQFINSDDVYCIVKPELLQQMAEYLELETTEGLDLGIAMDLGDAKELRSEAVQQCRRMIRSSNDAREEVRNEYKRKYKKKRRSAL